MQMATRTPLFSNRSQPSSQSNNPAKATTLKPSTPESQIGDEGSRFFMNQTHPFHPSKSLSFAHVLFVGFSLTYADTSGLKGYIAQDVVQVESKLNPPPRVAC